MPRGAKKSAHQHNNRHENGVVAPGKRIRKQKSNGHLNGNHDGTSPSPTPPSRSSSTSQPTNLPDKSINGSATHAKTNFHEGLSGAEFGGKLSHDSCEETDMLSNGVIHSNGFPEHGHRKIDVNAARNPATQDGGILHLSFTILRSCPLGDTIAILIFLLSLPSTLLTLTNALFAVLTFMPPAGSISSFPATFSDVFQGSGGTPSLATVLLTDTLGLILWLLIWSPLQVVALELAQAVVATTLGGGNSSKSGGSDTTVLCMLIVSLAHVARHKWSAKRLFGYEWSASLYSLPYISRTSPSLASDDTFSTRSPVGWFRVLIALHILIQGLVHVARRWYTKREYTHLPLSGKKVDPEAVASSHAPSEAAVSADSNCVGPGTSTLELRTKSSISSLKEPREKALIGKRKRKQATYARNQQPLWAAFAATKVTVLREYMKSQALSETVGSNATDTKNLGSAPFVLEEGCVWVTLVNSTSFCFDTSYFSSEESQEFDLEDSESPASASVDRTKPLYVRINGANWTSTKIERLPMENGHDESAERHWTGEVYGLSPASSYICSFVRSEDDVVIHSLNVSTPSLPFDDQEPSVYTTSPYKPQRPSSPTTPTTTLKNSIAVLEASILESQTRQKRNKKESKATTANLRKEIDALNAKISKIGNEDKAHYNRHLQWNQHYRQADEAIAIISSEIDAMGSVPEHDLEQWKEKKAAWEEARDLEASTRMDLLRCKEAAQREKSAIQAEATTIQQKRERLQSRNAKINDQLDRVQSATNQDLDEKERRDAEQNAKAADRQYLEEKSREQIATFQRSIQDTQYHTQQTWQQAQILENAFHQHQTMSSTGQTDRITPDGDLFGSNHPPTPISGFRFPAFATPEHSAPLLGNPFSLRHENRPRSTSLLSGNSVYTDFSDQDPAPLMPPSRAREAVRGRQLSGSSGSGSGSIGSQRDLMNPMGGVAPKPSPVVKRSSPVWN